MTKKRVIAGRYFFVMCVCMIIISCSPLSRHALNRQFKETEHRFQDHTGFMLYDPATQKTVYEYQSDRYFTPASNTKIFTLYACLNLLGDSIPAFRYSINGDSLIVWGTGDPTFLNSKVFENGRSFTFLQKTGQHIFLSFDGYYTPRFGPGWSWEDYDFSFSSERSLFPVYGNVFEVKLDKNQLRTVPSYFKEFITISPDTVNKPVLNRSSVSNATTFWPGRANRISKWTKPFMPDTSLVARLLSDTLRKPVKPVMLKRDTSALVLYSVPVDSVYKVMMQESDNFLAEQLLLLCAESLGDSIKPEKAIRFVSKNLLFDLPDEPVWKDGSGLSRYNLVTPRSVVRLWEKMYQTVPRDRLFPMLATGGVSGTVKNYYLAETPYIYGKTGTLSHVHCLSGYLITKRGKTLIFSFMNTNFTRPTREIKTRMEEVLRRIRENYK